MNSINFEALDAMAGEVLPERAMLGIVSTPFNNNNAGGGSADGSASASSSSSSAGGNTTVYAPDNQSTVVSSCQGTYTPGSSGLTDDLGLQGTTANSSMQCTPASVSQ